MATLEKVNISDVKLGMVIVKCDIKGVPFPEYGRPLSSFKYIEELKKYGVFQVYILISEKSEQKDYGYFSSIEGSNEDYPTSASKTYIFKQDEDKEKVEDKADDSKANITAKLEEARRKREEEAKYNIDDSNIVRQLEEGRKRKEEEEKEAIRFNSTNMNLLLRRKEEKEGSFEYKDTIDIDALLVAEEMLIEMQGEAKHALSGFFNNLSFLNTTNIMSVASDIVTMNNSDPGIFSRILSSEGVSQDDSHHAMSVCMHSVMLAQAIGIKGQELADISMAALLHDIGMVKVLPTILNKKAKLNTYEFTVLSKHPEYASAILSKYPNINENVIKIILQHHECLDGSGYPSKLTEPYICRAAQIVGIAEAYNSMLEFTHEYPMASSNTDAIRRLYKEADKKYSKKLIRHFINIMGVFPVGMGLALSNRQIGVVAEVNNIEQGRPKILMLDPQNSKEVEFIDLKKHPNIRIVREIPTSMMRIHPMQIFEDFLHNKLKAIFVDK